MKKLTLGVAVAGLTASLGAYAALPTGAAPFQVNIPNLNSGFEFNVTGFFMHPGSNGLDYANSTTSTTVNGIPTTNINMATVKPKYKPGFSLGIGYIFPNSANDVQLNWAHLTAKSSNSITGTNIDPTEATDLNALSANADVKYKYNAIDLDAGQYLNMGTRLQMRLFAGLRYADIKRDFDTTFGSVAGNSNLSVLVNQNSKTWGVGPRFGATTQYHLGHNFGVVANVATALLYSKVKADTTAQGEYDLSTEATANVTSNTVNRVVPEVEGKLGLDYSYPFSGSVFSVEAGYQMAHYFDAVDNYNDYNNVISRSTSSVSFDGPYLSLNLKV